MPRWEIVATDNNEKKIQVLVTSPILRFKDDLVIQVTEEEQKGESKKKLFKVNMRSKSRLGMSDFGYNAHRIQYFFNRLSTSIMAH